ncbi:restriction endonuclease fold toxin 5 domain-containing protein, partial [Corallococcus sp. AS-1-6]|uniref:restriction endonuclease fold toxin 5 domain-containing protein n=1 Tax=Corallococcus sp. AS-1-6 TaxID=2874599 RepID=UPI001CBF702C
GPEVARVFVLAVTVLVSHGVTMGLSSALSLMPRFPDAVRLGSAQAGFNPARVLDVSAVAVVDGMVEVTLASTAVAMATMGPPLPSSSGGPGKWVQVNESMSDRARDYQAQVTGAPKGSAYRLKQGDDEVDFDGFDPIEDLLLEAKGPGYAKFLETDAKMKKFFTGFNGLRDQAQRQLAMAEGRRIRWIVAEKPFAEFLRAAFSNLRFKIEVVYIPPRPPAP